MLNLTEELETKLEIIEVSENLSLDVLKNYLELIDHIEKDAMGLPCESWFTFAIMNSGLGVNCELLSFGMDDLTPELMLWFINDLEKINGGAK